jgi:hypothetical protein
MTFERSFLRRATRCSLIAVVLSVFLVSAGFALLNADDDPPVRDFHREQDAVAHDALTDDAPIPHDRIRASEHGDTILVHPAPVRDEPSRPAIQARPHAALTDAFPRLQVGPPAPDPTIQVHPAPVLALPLHPSEAPVRDEPPRPTTLPRPHAALSDAAPRLQARQPGAHAIQARPAPVAVLPDAVLQRRPAEPQLIFAKLLHVEIENPSADDPDYEAIVLAALQSGEPMELPADRLRLAQRLSLTGITGQECFCQIGEEKSKLTQARIDERTGSQTNSFQMVPVGTILTINARPMNENAFVLECDYESSRLAPKEEGLVIAQGGEYVVRTSDIQQLRVNTTVSIKPGEPIILSGANQISDDGQTIQTIIGLVLTTNE